MSKRALRTTVPAALALMFAVAGCAAYYPASNPGAAPAPAPAPVPVTPTDRLVSAIEANGCLLTADNVGAILMRANLTRDQLVELTPQLAAAGRAEVAASGTIRILSNNCI